MAEETERTINFEGLALSFVSEHPDFSLNLGQLMNMASYHAMMHHMRTEDVYDELIREVQRIVNSNEQKNGV